MATFLCLPTFIFFYCVGESAALSTMWAREIAVSRCLLQKPRKQRLLRQIRMATSSAFTLAALHCSHQRRHHEFKGREINDLQKWRRGWDSDSLHSLKPRNLLILQCARRCENARKAELRYKWGTRNRFCM